MEERTIQVGGTFIRIWLCNNHENEVWGFFSPEDPRCIPCELIKAINEATRLRAAVEWALGTVPVELIDNVEGWDIFKAFCLWQDELRRKAGLPPREEG